MPVSGDPASIAPLDEELELLEEEELELPEDVLLLEPLVEPLLPEETKPLELLPEVEDELPEDVLPLEEDTVEMVAGDSLLESEQAAMSAIAATEEKVRTAGLFMRACISAIGARATRFSTRAQSWATAESVGFGTDSFQALDIKALQTKNHRCS
jgi:hypothetical protein